jgi:Ni,Fe-hydrogenase III small subunit
VRQPRSRATDPFQRLLRQEEGIALVLALAVTVVIGMIGSTLMIYATGNQQKATRSSFDSDAHGFAEAGVNNAFSVLANPMVNPLSPTALPSSLATANTTYYDSGYVKWWGTFDPPTRSWRLNAVGYMRNPTGSTEPVTRRVGMSTTIRPQPSQALQQIPTWNYIVSTRTGTPGGCDQDLNNSAEVTARMYVMGNLCLATPSEVTGGPLMVKGNMTLAVNTNVGSSSSPISDVHVAGGCSYKGGAYNTPCGAADHVWASVSDATPVDLTVPTADFSAGGWYTNAAPGPTHGCTTQSGTVPVFDNDTIPNNSVPTVFNLTPPSSDYSCIVLNAAGGVIGQLSWDHAAKVLKIVGTVFIDGSAMANFGAQNVAIQYDGTGTLYLSGGFTVTNTMLCAVIVNGACDSAGWDPNKELLAVVTGNLGGVSSDSAVVVKSSDFQGALWSAATIEMDTHSNVQGPMVAAREIFKNTSEALPFPWIQTVPAGIPGNAVTSYVADPPHDYVS